MRNQAVTPREYQVLVLLANGGTDKTLADDLKVSVHTAHHHVLRAMQKMGATTRTSAVATAFRRGIIQ